VNAEQAELWRGYLGPVLPARLPPGWRAGFRLVERRVLMPGRRLPGPSPAAEPPIMVAGWWAVPK
jgi:hypothetical protein